MHQKLSNGYYIGPVTPSDKPAFVEHLNDRRIYENTLNIPYPYTEDDADRFVEHRVHNAPTTKRTLFAIRNAQGFLIGSVDVDARSSLVIGRDHASELGYWLAVPYWGNGVMSEAVKWLCEYAFRELELTRLTAHVFSFNLRSEKVLQKNGFQLEGVLKKCHRKDGAFIDTLLYALVY